MCAEIREIKAGEKYSHFKGGVYRIICIARDTESENDLVIYQNEREKDKIWARPLDMFCSLVDREKYPQIKQKYRFEKIEE